MNDQPALDSTGPRHLFESMTIDRILNLPTAQEREGYYVDFKLIGERGDCLSVAPDDRDNYAKLLSAFANSAGGVIVWGVNCKAKGGQDVATDVPGLPNPGVILDRLRQLQDEDVVPPVQAEHRIDHDDTLGKSFIVTYVAKSDGGPHRSLRHDQYFRRTSAGRCRHMEHDELADMFGRRPQPHLEVVLRVARPQPNSDPAFVLSIRNTGRGVARSPYLLVRGLGMTYPHVGHSHGPNQWVFCGQGIDGGGTFGLPLLTCWGPLKAPGLAFAGDANSVIHPGQDLDITRVLYFRSHDNADPIPPVEFPYTLSAADTPPRDGTINEPPPPLTPA